MKKEDKSIVINNLVDTVNKYGHFYIVDISGLNAELTHNLRKKCFEQNIELMVVKNTLFRIALGRVNAEFEALNEVLAGSTSVMFCENANAPARLIKEIKQNKAYNGKPELKAAYVQEGFYFGEQELENLINIKSKEVLLGEVIGILQSPMQNVLSALQSGGNTIHGVLKAIEEKNK